VVQKLLLTAVHEPITTAIRCRRRRAIGGLLCLVLIAGMSAASDAGAASYGDPSNFAGAFNVDWAPDWLAPDANGDVFVGPTYTNGTSYSATTQVTEIAPDGSQTVLAPVFNDGTGIAVDSAGDLFVADTGDNQVVEIAANGSESIVGSGLSAPEGLAVDSAGDLFVADTGNDRIVKISPDGSQTSLLSGVAIKYLAADARGDVFFPSQDGVTELSVNGTESVAADLGYAPQGGVAVDSIGDVIANSNFVTTVVAPNGDQQVFNLTRRGTDGLAVDPAGNIFVGDNDEFGTADIRELPIVVDPTSTSVQCGSFAPAGTPQTCTVTVIDSQTSSNVPTGTVDLAANGQGAFSEPTCTLSNGACTATYTPAVVGTAAQTVTADYEGDIADQPSTGSTTLTVLGKTSVTTVNCAKPTAAQKKAVQHGKTISLGCTATVKPSGSSKKPTGSVTFSANPATDKAEGFPAGSSCTLTGAERCTVKFATAAADSYTITATYGSDAYFGSSAGETTVNTG
jgi:hypothetical protein